MNAVDQVIIEDMIKAEKAFGLTTTESKYAVGTGQWKVREIDDQLVIFFTDDFVNDAVFQAILLPSCEVVEGSELVMYTLVDFYGEVMSLVLLMSRMEGGDL